MMPLKSLAANSVKHLADLWEYCQQKKQQWQENNTKKISSNKITMTLLQSLKFQFSHIAPSFLCVTTTFSAFQQKSSLIQ